MPRKTIPIYRLHKASGQAVVTLSGRTHYLGPFGSPASRVAYERAVIAHQAHGTAPVQRKPALTIAAMVAAYWRHIEAQGLYTKNGRPTSERSCIAIAMRPLARLFGERVAAEFGPRDLVTVQRALCEPLPASEGRKRVHTGPISRKSVNKHVHRVRRLFRWAAAMEMIPATTWQALRAVESLRRGRSREVRETMPVLPANLRAVVGAMRKAPVEIVALIRLQWLTGARPGEIVQLRMGDIDRSGDVWIYRPGSHKTQHLDRAREVMLGPKAQKVIAPFVLADPAAFLFAGRRKGWHLSESAYCKRVTRACSEAGIERWTPGQLRHNAATRFRSAQDIDTARTMLGHSDAGTTLIYAEADRRKAIALASAIG